MAFRVQVESRLKASSLDPRTKGLSHYPGALQQAMWANLYSKALKYHQDKQVTLVDLTQDLKQPSGPADKTTDLLDFLSNVSPPDTLETQLSQQLDAWRKEKPLPVREQSDNGKYVYTDAFAYWRLTGSHKYPLLAPIARRVILYMEKVICNQKRLETTFRCWLFLAAPFLVNLWLPPLVISLPRNDLDCVQA